MIFLNLKKGCLIKEDTYVKNAGFLRNVLYFIFVLALSALSVASGIIYFVIMSRSIVCPSCQNKFYSKDSQPKRIAIGECKNVKVLICPHGEAPLEKRVVNPFIVSAII